LKVAVIGSSGGMGRFFARYFLSHGDQVTGSDRRKTSIKHPRFTFTRSNAEAVKGAEVVVIATPIDSTIETVAEVAEVLSEGAVVIEMTSVKGRILGELKKKLAGRGLKVLSLHPLFGPSLATYGEMKVCVIDTEKGSRSLAHSLFPEATLIPMKEKEHDRMMGLILSLTHLVNIAYAGTISRYLNAKEFRDLQTPTSAVQLTLAEGVLSQSPSLYSYIQLENEYSSEFAGALIDELTQLRGFIDQKDRKGFEKRFSQLSEKYAGDSKAALDLVYQAFEKSSR
jgi:prephenate dehydrogenase